MPELSQRRRMLVLGICCMSLLIVGMDNTIVNIALTSIQRSFHASLTDLQWTIDAYTLVLASLLMLSGSTADRLDLAIEHWPVDLLGARMWELRARTSLPSTRATSTLPN